jgi:CHAT domain-containing protein
MQRSLFSFVYWLCIFSSSHLLLSALNPSVAGQQNTVKRQLLEMQKEVSSNSQQPVNFFKHKQHIVLGQNSEISSEETPENSQPKPDNEPQVLITEVVVGGEKLTPELEKLVYKTASTKPGKVATRSQLQKDVNAILGTGFFANVKVTPEDIPTGVRVTFEVEVNPILKQVKIETSPVNAKRVLPTAVINKIFSKQYGKVINWQDLQNGIKEINEWYYQQGYDLAQIFGEPPQVNKNGTVTLIVAEGKIEDIRVRYFDEEQPVDGITQPFIIPEMQLKSGDVFNRNTAQKDLQRVFGLGLFEDVRLSFEPGKDRNQVIINVDVVELRRLPLADTLITHNRKEYLQGAFNIYQQELQKYQSQKDTLGQAIVLTKLASAYRKFGNFEQAISFYNQIFPLWRMLPKQTSQSQDDASALGTVFSLFNEEGKVEIPNISHFQDTDSLELYSELPDFGEIVTIVNQSEVYRLLGDYQQAFDSLKEAKLLWDEKKDSSSQGKGFQKLFSEAVQSSILSSTLSSLYSNLGQTDEAFKIRGKAIEKLKISFDEFIQELTKKFKEENNIDLNRLTDKEVEEIKKESVGDVDFSPFQIYFILYDYIRQYHAVLFQILKMDDEEINSFFKQSNQSTPFLRWVEEEVANYESKLLHEKALINQGEQYYSRGKYQESLNYYHAALKILLEEAKNENDQSLQGQSDKLNNINKQAYLLSKIAQIHWKLGEISPALDFFQQALTSFQTTENFQGQIDTFIFLGQIYLNSNQYEKAITYYNQGYQVSKKAQDPSSEARVLFEKAVVKRIQSNYIEAKRLIEIALNRLEFQRCVGQDNQEKLVRGACPEILTPFSETKSIRFKSYINLASYFESKQKYYEFYIELLMELARQYPKSDYDLQALKANEENRARSLIALLNSARSNSQEMGQITTNLEFSKSLEVKEIKQKILDKNTVLLEYALGEDQSYLWLVTQKEIHSYTLPKRADIEAAAKEFYDYLTIPSLRVKENKTAEVGLKLSQMILAPIAEKIGQKRLLIVSDGILQYIPFSAIPIPQSEGIPKEANLVEITQPLLVKHEIINLPSASTLAVIRDKPSNHLSATQTLAVFADPVFGQKDQEQVYASLPKTREQAQQIIATLPQGAHSLRLFGYDANRQRAISPQLNQYQILHFATHGILDQEHPERSGVVLSAVTPQGELQRGLLSTADAFRLNLSADLVVLSGCRTGLGKAYRGEGIVGLTGGFLSSGTKRVAVSLWSVENEATTELMAKFYQGMFQQKLPPARALREAQLGMWQDKKWRIPYYWAAFTIQGEWKDLKRP